jgi:hypothetical protein
MAQTTWDVSRQGGGTYEFEQDAQGNYNLKTVGFDKLNKLNLPELKKEDVAQTSTTDVAKAQTDAMKAQTSKAFGDVRPTYDTGGGSEGQQSTAMTKPQYKTGMEGSPELAGQRPNIREVSGEVKKMTTEKDWRGNIATPGVKTDTSPEKTDWVTQTQIPGTTTFRTPPDQSYIDEDEKAKSYAVKPFAQRFKPSKTTTALKHVQTSLKPLANAVGAVLSPIVGGAKTLAGMVKESPTQKHNKQYFNANDNGRIAGNASTDLYAGMNRVSDFGNLEKAGANRISTREKTAEKMAGKWSQERMDRFTSNTEKMKGQQEDYVQSKAKNVPKSSPAKGSFRAAQEEGTDSSSSDSGRVICTELHRTKELSTQDWIRDTRFTFNTLTENHIKGYLIWAIPTVKYMKKYPTYRKIWKHIAQHRANDIAWRLNEGKFDLFGRIYAGIGEPLCWLIGNFTGNKQINELNIKNWRKA